MLSYRVSNGAIEFLRGKLNYFHCGKSSMTTAFEIQEKAKIRVLLPRQLGVVSVKLRFYDEYLHPISKEIVGEWIELYNSFDKYDFNLHIKDLGVGIYFFDISIQAVNGMIYGYRCSDELIFKPQEMTGDLFQLSVCDFKYEQPEEMMGGIIYHIFVDRFNRGGNTPVKDGAVMVDDWTLGIPEYPAYPGAPLKNNRFYGGTLYGIIDKLEYIASLGVSTLYLSPIFDAASNHKYDTGDYMSVDKMFGDDSALKMLIERARDLKIGIILDGVFNHTGSDSIYFNREGHYKSIGAYQSQGSEYYSWYDFQKHPNKYTCWWGIDILPRINPDIPECRSYFISDGGVIDKYASMGIEGFRLDVADELSDSFISDIKAVLSKHNSHSILYGEVWEDASNKIAYDKRKHYYLGAELDGVMNYPVRVGIIEYLKQGKCDALRYALTEILNNAPKRIRDMQMNLLGTHDTERIITVLGGEDSRGRSNDYLSKKRMNEHELSVAVRRLKQAYTILCTIPGIPAIFYGDEAGLEGYHDPFNRMPYPWGRENTELLDFYKKLGGIRRENSVYAHGDFKLIELTPRSLIFERMLDGYAYVTVINNSSSECSFTFNKLASPLINGGDDVRSFKIAHFGCEIFKTTYGAQITIK